MTTKEKIEKILRVNLSIQKLTVVDDSNLHIGHAGAREGGESHFSILIVSSSFKGKTLIQRHRMVNEALKDELKSQIHALTIKTLTPKEYGL